MILSIVGGVAVGAVLDKLSLSGCQGSVFGAVVTMIVLVPDYPEDLCWSQYWLQSTSMNPSIVRALVYVRTL